MRNGFVIGLVIVVVAAAAALGGFFYGTSVGEARANQVRQNFFAQRNGQGGNGGGGGFGQGGQGGQNGQGNRRGTAGTVKSINGNTMQVSTRDSVVTVNLSSQTQVEKQAPGSLSDIKAGERVVVVGSQGSGGTVAAQSVQVLPQFMGPGGNPTPTPQASGG